MPLTQHTRFAALRDPTAVVQQLENKHLPMDASEYLTASRRITGTLRTMGIIELLVIARGMLPVLSQLADNVLIERGADHLVGDIAARSHSRAAMQELIARL
jgi:hypothetical protein